MAVGNFCIAPLVPHSADARMGSAGPVRRANRMGGSRAKNLDVGKRPAATPEGVLGNTANAVRIADGGGRYSTQIGLVGGPG